MESDELRNSVLADGPRRDTSGQRAHHPVLRFEEHIHE